MLILAAAPLGDPRDASAHLRQVIIDASHIAAEDSRKFTRLCSDLGIKYQARVISFFEGNELERIDELVAIMRSGSDLLVITDAGLPGVSDPGYRLIRAAIENEIAIKVLPGPSAVTTALLLSGLATDRFCFEGFPPRTQGARQTWFTELAEETRTVIFFEAPHRIIETLSDAVATLGGERQAAICREMTKTYEETIRGSLNELLDWANSGEVRGEITMVLAGFDPSTRNFLPADLVTLVLAQEAAGISRKEAIVAVAKSSGLAKRLVFDAMVDHKSGSK